MQTLHLLKNQERRLLAGHLWIYSNEIDVRQSPLKQYQPGELVQVFSSQQQPLGIAYINPRCLLVARLLTRHARDTIDEAFFIKRITRAIEQRERLFSTPYYRAVYGESDGLPGLVIDRFNDVWVIQANTAGMDAQLNTIIAVLPKIRPANTIVLANESTQRTLEGLENYRKIAVGDATTCRLIENECEFELPLLTGQKTAWFYDHRASRRFISQYAKGKTVLDVFSYLGGFALSCAKQGASRVVAIDSSEAALAGLQHNAALNALTVEIIAENAFIAMKTLIDDGQTFDIVIVDPPALIKKKKDEAEGMQAYQKLNELALQLLAPQALLLTASCSMHLASTDLKNLLRRASVKQKRPVSILHQCHQDADHPIHPAIEETEYLKGFVVAGY